MNRIDRIVFQALNVQEFATAYLSYLSELLSEIDTGAIADFIGELEKARKHKNTVFIIGNGGSAATASHMANDLSVGVGHRKEEGEFRAISLTDNVAAMTAIANDFGYEEVFVYQLRAHYRPGDKLVAISASGNSPNVVAAAKWVKKRQGTVIGLVGFDGGKLKDCSDVCLHTKTAAGEYGPVEDIHMILDHLIYTWLSKNKI
jgi:D-sedoheptulose 7-phosphate isomerase